MNNTIKRGGIILSGILLSVTLIGCGHHKTPEEKAEWISNKVTKKLELDEGQQASLKNLTDQVLIARKAIHENKKAHKETLKQIIQQPTLDRDALQNIVSEMTSRINQQSPAVIQALGEFYDGLNDQQREEIREHLLEKLEDDHHHHGW